MWPVQKELLMLFRANAKGRKKKIPKNTQQHKIKTKPLLNSLLLFFDSMLDRSVSIFKILFRCFV